MQIFWVNIDNIKYNTLLEKIKKLDKQNIIFTPNPEILLKAKSCENFKKILNKANYLTADWVWLYIAFQINDNKYWKIINTILIPYYFFNLFFRRKYLYKKYWERICWSDLTSDLLEFAQKNNVKITIIDLHNPNDFKKIESQKVFRNKLKERFKNLDLDYFIYDLRKKDEIIAKICKSESKILFSTLWMKAQEESIVEIMNKCKNIKLWLWVWSSFDYFVWFQKRAPKFLRSLWFEWLYRLITWPQKIKRIKRLWNAIFVFIFKVLLEKK